MTGTSALYVGDVVHVRHRPRQHRLRYGVFTLLLDLDELPVLDRTLSLFSYNRFGAFSFNDADHGSGTPGTLKAWIGERLDDAGIQAENLSVAVLCYPRVLGYGFNPLTVYFCRDGDGTLLAMLYEVCNTFRERHTYVVPVANPEHRTIRHECDKAMYVSPFMPMECRYRFRIAPPQDDVLIAIDEHDAKGSLLFASFNGKRKPLTSAALWKMLALYPLMTLKIMGGIHLEAFRLWKKGLPVYRHKKAADPIAISLVPTDSIIKSETP